MIASLLAKGDIETARAITEAFAAETGRHPSDVASLYGELIYYAARNRNFDLYSEYLSRAISVDAAKGHYFSAYYVDWQTDTKRSANSVVWLTNNVPESLRNLKIDKIWAAYRELLSQNRNDDIFALLSALYTLGYEGYNEAGTADFLTLEYVKRLVKRGEVNRAIGIALMDIRLVPAITSIWHDRHFEPLWAPLEALGKFDVDNMLQQELARNVDFQGQVAMANLAPNEALIAFVQVIQSLRQLDKSNMVELFVSEVATALSDEEKNLQGYMWLKNELAYALRDQGKIEEALTTMQEITELDISKNRDLINQWINYAGMLQKARRYDDALEVTQDILTSKRQYMSPYGLYWTLSIRACSLVGKGQFGPAEDLFAEMETKPEDNYSAISMAGLCLEKYDRLAELYIERLNDDLYRTAALFALSTYTLPNYTDEAAELQRRLDRIRQQPDVQAVVKSAGRVNDWPFPSIYWGDY